MTNYSSNMDSLLKEIDSSLSNLISHPDYSKVLYQEDCMALREEALIHSLNMEIDENELVKPDSSSLLKKLRSGGIFLEKNGISLYSLARLGNIVEPSKNLPSSFRKTQVKFGSFYGSEPSRIYYEVNSLVETINERHCHPILCAAQSHLEWVRIHPHLDGNGRNARIIQNYILHVNNYPSVIIAQDNKPHYIHLLNDALMDRLNHKSSSYSPSDSEMKFYQFISEGVSNSIQFLQEQIESSQSYSLDISPIKNPGVVQTIAKRIKQASHHLNHPICTSVKKGTLAKKTKSIVIRGNIPQDDLLLIVGKACNSYPVRYDLTKLK